MFGVRTLRATPLGNFKYTNNILTVGAMLYMRFPEFIHFTNETLNILTSIFLSVPCPLPPLQVLGNLHSTLCFCEFDFSINLFVYAYYVPRIMLHFVRQYYPVFLKLPLFLTWFRKQKHELFCFKKRETYTNIITE